MQDIPTCSHNLALPSNMVLGDLEHEQVMVVSGKGGGRGGGGVEGGGGLRS